jgi:4-hydroxybenzoate polyprenyltransferase
MVKIKNYLSLVKFSHTIFAMPFAMIGFFLGFIYLKQNSINVPGIPGLYYPKNREMLLDQVPLTNEQLFIRFILVVFCMIFARSAAMAFNRWLDKHFDALNPRTAIREIPAGIVSANNALFFVIFNCIAFIATTYFINRTCFYLSPVALFVVLFYSYTKRFTALCHLVLGVGLSLAPIGAYLAVTGEFALLPCLFSFAVVFWVSGFDIIYALQDVEFDQSQELHSIPAWLGRARALNVSELLHVLSVACVVLAGVYGNLWGVWYWVGVAIFAGMLVYQHAIVKPNDLSRVNVAFITANGIASVVFACFVITDILI